VIAVDTNLLVYAHRKDSEFHRPALDALFGLARQVEPWGLPWPCVHEFVAIVTHPRIYDPPSGLAVALKAIEVWLGTPGCRPLGEGPGYFVRLKELALQGRIQGPAIHDARVAALCLHHGVNELWTADRDFSRFAGLKTRNPLVGPVPGTADR